MPTGTAPSVDRVQIGNFVKTASAEFGTAIQALNELNRTAKNAVFSGSNGVAFKGEVQLQLSKFSTDTKTKLAEITTASNNACRAIGTSLGEDISVMTFNPEGFQEQEQEGNGSDTITVDYTSMEGVRSALVTNITTVSGVVSAHRTKFEAIPWTGRAKNQAVTRVTELCNAAVRECQAMAEQISTKITAQIEATDSADNLGA